MASTVIAFTPSTVAAFSFQPVLNSVQYNCTVTWGLFGQRYYINLTDLSGNLILARAMTSSGPRLEASLTWAGSTATATTSSNHNVPVGWVVKFRVYDTDTGFDGTFTGLSTGPNTLTYALPVNPQQPIPLTGTVSFDLNLVDGYLPGALLLYHYETQQIEYA